MIPASPLLFALCLALHATYIGARDLLYAPLDYAVVGQQKCGTSTLWMHLSHNPYVRVAGYDKESFQFQTENPISTLCDSSLERLQQNTINARGAAGSAGLPLERVRVGDWSATHLSCACCPMLFRMVNPGVKVVVLLRDPIQRSISRYLEQRLLVSGPLHAEVKDITFATYINRALWNLQRCLAAAHLMLGQQIAEPDAAVAGVAAAGKRRRRRQRSSRRLAQSLADAQADDAGRGGSSSDIVTGNSTISGGGGGGISSRGADVKGWGASMDLHSAMVRQCYQQSNILGWSTYDIMLENYIANFPPEQLLVLYTEDLATTPLATLRRVEDFLGVPQFQYNDSELATIYNARGCYGWKCVRGGQQATTSLESTMGDEASIPEAVDRLKNYFRPHIQRLQRWAEQGLIAPLPYAWHQTYGKP